jgi:hypothetical protein
VFTLLRSGHTFQQYRNGTIPHRIPPVNALATTLPSRPPVCSASHFPLAPFTGSAENRASVLLPLRCRRTLAAHISKNQNRSPTKNKKDYQGSPRSVPCKGPGSLRVRPAKISTAWEDEPLPHLPQEGGGSIFPGIVLLRCNPTVSRVILYAPVFVPLYQATRKPCA